MAPNLLTVRLDCSGLQHKRFVHFVRLSSSRDLGGRDFAIIWAKFSARIRKTPAHNPNPAAAAAPASVVELTAPTASPAAAAAAPTAAEQTTAVGPDLGGFSNFV